MRVGVQDVSLLSCLVIKLCIYFLECRPVMSDLYLGCYADIQYESAGAKHDMAETAITYQEGGIIGPCISTCRKRGFKYAGARVSSISTIQQV